MFYIHSILVKLSLFHFTWVSFRPCCSSFDGPAYNLQLGPSPESDCQIVSLNIYVEMDYPNLGSFLGTWDTAHDIVWVCVLSQLLPFCPILSDFQSTSAAALLYLPRIHIPAQILKYQNLNLRSKFFAERKRSTFSGSFLHSALQCSCWV